MMPPEEPPDGDGAPKDQGLEIRGLALILLAVLLVTLWRWCRIGWSG
jgi:hypothetical protein